MHMENEEGEEDSNRLFIHVFTAHACSFLRREDVVANHACSRMKKTMAIRGRPERREKLAMQPFNPSSSSTTFFSRIGPPDASYWHFPIVLVDRTIIKWKKEEKKQLDYPAMLIDGFCVPCFPCAPFVFSAISHAVSISNVLWLIFKSSHSCWT